MLHANDTGHWPVAVLGALALCLLGYVPFYTSTETVYAPLPLLMALPIFLLPFPHLALIVPPLLFAAWNPQLFLGVSTVPKRTYIAFAILIGLSVVYFISSWKYGVKYQGIVHTKSVCTINALLTVILAILLTIAHRAKCYSFSFAFSWGLFAWLTWYAFPYLGEMP